MLPSSGRWLGDLDRADPPIAAAPGAPVLGERPGAAGAAGVGPMPAGLVVLAAKKPRLGWRPAR